MARVRIRHDPSFIERAVVRVDGVDGVDGFRGLHVPLCCFGCPAAGMQGRAPVRDSLPGKLEPPIGRLAPPQGRGVDIRAAMSAEIKPGVAFVGGVFPGEDL